LPWLPIIWQIILFSPVFIFLNNTVGKSRPNFRWAGMWIFYFGNWVGLQNNGSQPYGVFLAFATLAALSSFIVRQEDISRFARKTTAIAIVAAVAIGHLLSSFVAFALAAGAYVNHKRVSLIMLIAVALIIISWNMFGASGFLDQTLAYKLNSGLRLDEALLKGPIGSVTGSDAYAAVSRMKIVFSAILLAIAVAGGILALRSKSEKRTDYFVLCAAGMCVLVAGMVGGGYGGEIFNRFFLYLLPFVAYFGIKLLYRRNWAICLTIVIAGTMPLSFIAQHGNQTNDYLSNGYVNGVNFFADNTSDGWIEGVTPLGQTKNIEKYHTSLYPFKDLKWSGNELDLHERRTNPVLGDAPDYICLSNHDEANQTYRNNSPGLVSDLRGSLEKTTNADLVFSNGDMSMYIHEGIP
jgi:hypothetical protein